MHRRNVRRLGTWVSVLLVMSACERDSEGRRTLTAADSSRIVAEVEAAVWAFHAADTARHAEGVIGLLWPEFSMLVDGTRMGYDDIASGSRAFMASLEAFHTEWSDLEIVPLGPDVAVSSFLFRDSLVTREGEVIRSWGPTTLTWQRRGGVWRARSGDADHYPIEEEPVALQSEALAVAQAWTQAWNDRDFDAMSRMHDVDLVYYWRGRPRGYDTFMHELEAFIFPGEADPVELIAPGVQLVAPGVAVAGFQMRGTGSTAGMPEIAITLVLVDRPDGWKVVHIHESPVRE